MDGLRAMEESEKVTRLNRQGVLRFGDPRDASIQSGLASRGEIEMRKPIRAAAFVAMVFTALSASAQPNDPYDYPYCLQGRDYGLPGLCQFTSYQQCQASAYGTFSYCGVNPRFAYGWQQRGWRPYQVR